MAGGNNPRVFAQTITLDAWRTAFDGARGEADLHIDVVFAEAGPVGGEGSPVRFRLSLKRAEVHVIRDSEGVIGINRQSISRSEPPPPIRAKKRTEKTIRANGQAGARAGLSDAAVSVAGRIEHGIAVTEIFDEKRNFPNLEVTHWPTEKGYSFRISAGKGKRISGPPWTASKAVMKIRDTNHKRKRGEAPEVRIEIHCLREDLVIENVEFTESNFPSWAHLPHKKKIAVEQYIKDELSRAGFDCGDLSEPFTRIILADAIPSVEQ